MLLWKLFETAVGEGIDVAACLPLAEHVACDGFVLVVLQAFCKAALSAGTLLTCEFLREFFRSRLMSRNAHPDGFSRD